jgi:hypothetical protein
VKLNYLYQGVDSKHQLCYGNRKINGIP